MSVMSDSEIKVYDYFMNKIFVVNVDDVFPVIYIMRVLLNFTKLCNLIAKDIKQSGGANLDEDSLSDSASSLYYQFRII